MIYNKSKIIIRNAVLTDIDNIKKIADKNTKSIGFIIRGALEESCNKKTLIIAEQEDNILGFCNFNRRRDSITVIYEICVGKEYRGLGIGGMLISELPLPIRLKCPIDNESNIFYKKQNFELIDIEKGKKRMLNVWYKKSDNGLFD